MLNRTDLFRTNTTKIFKRRVLFLNKSSGKI